MLRIFILALLLFPFNLFLMSQSGYLPGYIITNDNDTLNGHILNQGYSFNAQYCEFRETAQLNFIKYYPNQIMGYRFNNGKYYISKNVVIDGSQQHIFLEFLVEGKLNLFFLLDTKGKNHYFVQKDSSNIIELIHINEILHDNGRQYLYEKRKFIGVLRGLTYDCPQVEKQIQKMKVLTHKNLIVLVKDYNNLACTEKQCMVYVKDVPRKVLISSSAGLINIFSPSSKPSNLFSIENEPTYGVNVMMQIGHRHERLFYGIGVAKFFEGMPGLLLDGYQIPFSINYFDLNKRVSPYFSYQFDINRMFLQAINLGILFNTKKIATAIVVDLKSERFVNFYGMSYNLNLSYKFN